MTTSEFHFDSTIERDLLISRVVDGRASAADWSGLDRLAQRDPAVWRDLAQAQREHALLSGAVLDEIAPAERIDIPAHEAASYKLNARLRTAGVWGGWAAAAAVALAWMGGLPAQRDGGPAGNTASLSPFSSASDALAAYLDLGKKSGRVIQEMPAKVLVDEPQMAADGHGYEVVYLRQIVERDRVPDLYRFSRDETGQVTSIPVQIRRITPKGSNPM